MISIFNTGICKLRLRMIPLTTEEYFENDVCMNCYHVMDYPVYFYMPENQVLELCENCGFGVYQCFQCRNLVSHLEGTPYREMVYTGPNDTFEDSWIMCHECVGGVHLEENLIADQDDTDIEEDFEICEEDTATQILC